MGNASYYPIEDLISFMGKAHREACLKLFHDHEGRFKRARGSSHNHQAWNGGYLDHVVEVMNLGIFFYDKLTEIMDPPFSMADVMVVLFLHDLEKAWKYTGRHDEIVTKKQREEFRLKVIDMYGIEFTEKQANALKYVEGEGDDYSSEKRVMNELAAFCHICDVASARIRHDHPKNNRGHGEREW